MTPWLTPKIAIVLMLLGVFPSLATIALLYDDRGVPGVFWFLISMGTGAAWALVFSLMTLISSPPVTLALANIFWSLIPIAAVSLFLLAYEFTFKTTIKRQYAAVLFAPIGIFFLLSWVNPSNLVYAVDYGVNTNGYLTFPQAGGVLRLAITQVYGYLLVIFAAGLFIGEAMNTKGIHQQQALYLLLVFSALVISTIVKVAGVVPIYYDLTSTVYGLSGMLFAYSINQHGFLQTIPTARDKTFNEISDAILVVNEDGQIIDANNAAERVFKTSVTGTQVDVHLPDYATPNGTPTHVDCTIDGTTHTFSVKHSTVTYGRDLTATTITLSDVTQLKKQGREIELLKEILSRMFRHNIRNDLTVIMGYTQQIRDRGSDEMAKIAGDIAEISEHIEGQTEKAGKIEKIIEDSEQVQKPLHEFIDTDDFASIPGYTTTEVTIDLSDVYVEAHPALNIAVQEAVENAIIHNTTDRSPTVNIYTERTKTDVFLVIEDNGPGIPQHEIEVLESEEETSLSHSTGIGLWLIQWIVNYSNGELVTNTTENGTLINIRLDCVDTEQS